MLQGEPTGNSLNICDEIHYSISWHKQTMQLLAEEPRNILRTSTRVANTSFRHANEHPAIIRYIECVSCGHGLARAPEPRPFRLSAGHQFISQRGWTYKKSFPMPFL
jgi:hypothetical protein